MYLDGSRTEIIRWVEQGVNDGEIADRLRVSRSTVRYWRQRNGVVRPEKPKASKSAKTSAQTNSRSEKPKKQLEKHAASQKKTRHSERL